MGFAAKVYGRLQGYANVLSNKSPWFYFHLHNYLGTQHGSLKGTLKTPKLDKVAKNVLIFTNRYWLIHAATDMAFAKEFQNNGFNVTVVGCDELIKTCDNDWYGQPLNERPVNQQCLHCASLLRKLAHKCGVHYVSMREYLMANPVMVQGDLDYSKVVYTSWIRLLRMQNPTEKGEFELKDKLIESAQLVDSFLESYFQREKVDKVLMTNGKFFGEQLLRIRCEEKSIPYLTVERGSIKETLMFGRNKPAIPADTPELWRKVKDTPLSEQERKQLHEYLGIRKLVGNAEEFAFYKDIVEEKDLLVKELGIDQSKKLFVLFTNSIWDSSVTEEDTIFEHMFDWIVKTIDFFKDRKDCQLIIRVHPVEFKVSAKQKTRETVQEIISRAFPQLPSNLIMVPPESEMSSYTLMDLAEVGLLYTSTVGIEMALRNKSVIVNSNAHYRSTDFVYTPEDQEAYFELLANAPEPRPNQVEIAERYAYMFYFRHMVPYGKWVKQENQFQFTNDFGQAQILETGNLLNF